jgi:hypothetical protein
VRPNPGKTVSVRKYRHMAMHAQPPSWGKEKGGKRGVTGCVQYDSGWHIFCQTP